MSKEAAKGDYDVGYGKAPEPSRFQKGRSGNPNGRPKGKNRPPYHAVLGQIVTVREDGVERRVTAAEAFLLHMSKRGLEGDGAAARSAMTAIEEARSRRGLADADQITVIIRKFVTPGSVNSALEPLRMATKMDPFRPTARMLLEPWLVEEALSRLGERRLTLGEQTKVVKATRTPRKVRWPKWWEIGV